MDMVNESIEIDQKFFDLFVEHDFLEVAAHNDVQLESTLMAIDEGFLGGVWDKIIEFLKKIKDKIVSIFKAAAVKIGAFFTKDNASLVSRYQKQFNNSDLTIVIKGFRKMKANPVDLINGFTPDSDFAALASKNTVKELEKVKKDTTVTKMMKNCNAAVKVSGNIDSGKLDYLKALFENPKDIKAQEIATFITDSLTNHQDAIKKINDVKDSLNEIISKMEEKAQKYQDDANKIEGNEKDVVERRQVENKRAEVARTICTVTNACVGKLSSAALDAVKFNIKQCRAAYIKIASKGAPNVHDESTYLEAVLDSDEYEVDSFFDQYSYDYDELTA